MDIISQLSDDLLLRVLSFVPTEDVVATSLLSKRWRFLWRLVPHLEYNDSNHSGDYKSFYQFVYRSLLSNKAPVVENLHLKLGDDCPVIDIGLWIDIAVSRRVRNLEIDISSSKEGSVTLPSSLYTSDTLETLILIEFVLLNVPFSVCLPSLKVLRLKRVDYLDNTSIPSLLSGCPNLEELFLERHHRDKTTDNHCRGAFFTKMIWFTSWKETPIGWKPPSSVPECLLFSLEAFEWDGYKGRRGDREMSTYILKNAVCLKTATFSPESTDVGDKYQMLKDLASIPTASTSSQLLFD